MSFEIAVVGSINSDVSVMVERLPERGETVSGGDLKMDGGGKGANQAVAAARLGRRVTLGAAVGDDPSGRTRLAELAAEGIDVSSVERTHHSTGTALITVDASGDNTIVVAPGANRHLSVQTAVHVAASAAVTLIQYEIPDEAVRAAVERSLLSIVNAAPFRAIDGVVGSADVLVVNETELASLTGDTWTTVDAIAGAARQLGVPRVAVTLGAAGAIALDRGEATHVAPPAVEVLDTTGAGDAFAAGLADSLVSGASLADAVGWAVRVGAAATLRRGAQSAMPTRAEVEAL